jgi:hypothetical protein
MSFNPLLLVKLQPSSLLTDPATIPTIAISPLVPQYWLYNAGSDTIGTVITSGYFNYFANWTNTLEYNNGQFFRVGDCVYVVAEDGNTQIQIASLDPITSTVLPPGPMAIVNADIAANAAIAFSKLAALPSANILVGSAGNVATAVAITGDVTIANTGVTTISNLAVTAGKIANATITTAQISATAGIVGTQLANATITANQIANNTITGTQLATSVPQVIRVPITSANFKTAWTAGLAMIPSAGANTIIIIDDVTYSFNFLTAAYTLGGAIGLQYSTAAPVHAGGIAASGTVAAVDVTGLVAAGYESAAGLLAINGAAGLVNAGVWLTVATQDFATGAGTVVANIQYHVITI